VKTSDEDAREYSIAVPGDTKPFIVEQDELVRLVGRGIAGSEIMAKITGPAKLIRSGYRRQVLGGMSPIGGTEKEFEFRATGAGQVTVTLTTTFPTGGKPQSVTYRFALRDRNAEIEPQ
jgi:hypothetical protein